MKSFDVGIVKISSFFGGAILVLPNLTPSYLSILEREILLNEKKTQREEFTFTLIRKKNTNTNLNMDLYHAQAGVDSLDLSQLQALLTSDYFTKK